MRPTYHYYKEANRPSDVKRIEEHFQKVLTAASAMPVFVNEEYAMACSKFLDNLKVLIEKS
jgi:hypothetical protein